MKFGRGRLTSLVGALVAVPALLALTACAPNPVGGDPADAAVTTAPASAGLEVPAEPADTTLPPDAGPSTTIVKVSLDRTLNKGDSGDDVLRLQQRLKDLAFDPGKIDGIYGDNTAESVWAYKTLILGERWDKNLTSKVTAENWDRMQDPLGWMPQKTGDTPRHFEVFLPEQVGVLVSDGKIRLITHVSSGSGKHWCNERRVLPDASGTTPPTTTTGKPLKYCNDSITPAGAYRFRAKRTGTFAGFYGDLWNPTFFNGGIAVHGFDSVPYYPASHGCVRIPNHIADYFQSLVRIGDQVFVFDGVNDPELLGEVVAKFDQVDPDSTSTTSSSTTTTVKPTTTTPKVTTTVAAPATTAPPVTTVKPATTVAPVTAVPAPPTTKVAVPTATTQAPGTSPPAVPTTLGG